MTCQTLLLFPEQIVPFSADLCTGAEPHSTPARFLGPSAACKVAWQLALLCFRAEAPVRTDRESGRGRMTRVQVLDEG